MGAELDPNMEICLAEFVNNSITTTQKTSMWVILEDFHKPKIKPSKSHFYLFHRTFSSNISDFMHHDYE